VVRGVGEEELPVRAEDAAGEEPGQVLLDGVLPEGDDRWVPGDQGLWACWAALILQW
jgi:hypothetical protein